MTGTTYAIFTTTTTQEGTNTIETLKCLELEFSNQKNVINLSNTYPMLDERGMKNTPYTFTLTNKCGTYVEYSIGLAINKDNTLEDKYVKTIFSLASDTGEPVLLTDRVEGNTYNNKKTYIFRNDGLENNASKDYKLILWIDESATTAQKGNSFLGNIIINTKPIKNEGQKTITVDLDGGNLLQELNEIYREGMKIKLPVPAKAGYHFTKWEITAGDATIDENNYLTIGKENISLKAYYQGGLTLTLELNGGSTTQTINDFYGSGEKVTLIEPTKEGYKFGGWKITSGDGTLDGNVLTINTESIVIEVIWSKALAFTVDLNGGSTTQTFASVYYEDDELELVTPTKTNSVFAGWEITSGNALISNNKLTFETSDVSIKALWEQTWNFDFTGSEQTFTVPYSGYYKLETWGAQGGNATYDNTTYIGGFGSYSTGKVYLEKGTTLYINTGGQGQTLNNLNPSNDTGYNGGGFGSLFTNNSVHGGGGGATHIATKPGLLKDLANDLNSILIVSGGGGGASAHNAAPKYSGNGGNAGGYLGVDGGIASTTCYAYGNGGTQTSPGGYTVCSVDGQNPGGNGDIVPSAATFGYGGNYTQFGNSANNNYYTHAGGGGGYYGGGSGFHAPGGGGSGYIGNSQLLNKIMYCANCKLTEEESLRTRLMQTSSSLPYSSVPKQVNGYAKIMFYSKTYKEENYSTIFSYTGSYQEYTVPKTGTYKIELWGAQAANSASMGGYTSGEIELIQNEKIYFYIGQGLNSTANGTSFNGGTADYDGFPGGGATDVRLVAGAWNDINSLRSRIMVAGGSGYTSSELLGAGGGLVGYDGNKSGGSTGGTQTSVGAKDNSNYADSSFGVANGGCPGGNGYYPGGGATCVNGSGGGSSYISGHTGCVAITSASDTTPKSGCTTGTTNNSCSIHYSGKKFTNTVMIDGAGYKWTNVKGAKESMPDLTGFSPIKTGNIGYGFAKITLIK